MRRAERLLETRRQRVALTGVPLLKSGTLPGLHSNGTLTAPQTNG